MSWPLSQDYNEAIQSPRSNFTDADLQRGEAVCNALGLPAPYSGNFADVYQVRCPDGSRWAVKCFTREAAGLRERYQEISAHLKQAKLPFSVDFSYLEKGIRVAGKWHPVLKMQWVEGLTLNQFVAQYLDKPAMLEALIQIWARMAKYLRASDVAHCDLQHGNVLLVPGATANSLSLKLIDYDGMWVPALAGKPSGEVGHPSYQHPQRLREGTYSLDVDRFPVLLIATAMRAVKADKGLWAKYDNGDNLLFKEPDLAAPARSELFQDLACLPDPGLVMLGAQVRAALKGGLESAALLEEAMPETRPAPAAKAPPSAVTTRKTVPIASPVAVQPAVSAPSADALAFEAAEASAPRSFVRKKKRGKEKPAGVLSRVPLAAWIGGGVGLAVIAIGGILVAVLTLGGKPNPPAPVPPENRVAQKEAGAPIPPVARPDPGRDGATPPKDEAAGGPVAPKAPEPPVVPDEPQPVVNVPEAPQDKPGVREVKTFEWNIIGPTRSLRLSADGNLALALSSDGYICLNSTQSGIGVDGFRPPDFQARAATLSPDGRQAVVAGDDKAVHVWAFAGRKELFRMTGHTGPINWVDVSPDGKRAVSCGDDGKIFWWDLEAHKEIAHWKGSEKPISVVRFSPDGQGALSYGPDAKIHFWDLESRRETGVVERVRPGDPGKPVTGAFLSADTALVGFTTTYGHWDLKQSLTTSSFGGGPVCAVAASGDGRLAAFAVAGAPEFIVLDEKRRGVFWPCRSGPPVAPEGLSFARDGRHILAGCTDGTVHYWAVNPDGADGAAPVAVGPTAPPTAPSIETGWGKPVDPDGDCKFTPEKTALTIEVPAKAHDLAIFRGVMNAPRLLRDVEGDFTIQVRIGGEFRPSLPSTIDAFAGAPFVSGSLVVMVDDRNYQSFARTATSFARFANSNDSIGINNSTAWLLCADASPTLPAWHNVQISDAPTYLRLRRAGDRFFPSISQDGNKWTELETRDFKMPAKVKVGLAATSASSAPFKVRFDDFRLTGGGVPAPAPAPAVVAEKRQPPAADDLAKTLEEIKTTFKESYDGIHSPKDAYALSGKLLAEARRAKDQPARQYALFVEARDLAARGEDLPTSLEIIDETAAAYVVNVKEAKTAALLAAGKTFSNRAAAKAYLDAAIPLLEQARADDDYDLVAPLLPAVRQACADAQQPDLTKTASALVTQMESLQGEYKAVQPALTTLKEKPDDADANLAAGKFYALRKQDWDKGAPLLAKGSDAALSEAALKEDGPPSTAADRTAAGDAWWKAGEKDAMFKTALHRRALLWYDKALPDLTDKEEERVRNRVIELTKQFPDFATAWADLDVSKAEVVGNCYLRLKPGQTLATKQPSTGVFRVTVAARAAKPLLIFEMLQSYKEPRDKEVKDILIEWELKDKVGGVWLSRQVQPPRKQNFSTSAPINPEAWNTYHCDLREDYTNFGVNDRTLMNVANKNDPTRARTFEVRAIDQILEIKSFTVKPIARP